MGQAKRNREAGIQNRHLLYMGAFYRDDQDVGFSVTFTKDMGIDIDLLSSKIDASSYDKFIGKPGCPATKEAMRDDLFEQLDTELVPFLCQKLYGQPTQPAVGVKKMVDIKPVLKEILIFVANVQWLEVNGYLKSDTYNGMLYAYQVK